MTDCLKPLAAWPAANRGPLGSRLPLAWTCLALIVACGPASAQGRSAPVSTASAPADPVPMNSKTFHIPFRVDTTAGPATRVDLYVSRGDGATWERADHRPPDTQAFRFVAEEDGLYWFATRTIDASGRPHPQGPLAPQLQVRVDTAPPEIELEAEANEYGEVTLAAVVRDDSPARVTQIRYATDVERRWQSLDASRLIAGEPLQFSPDHAWQQMQLYAEATDSAGNLGSATGRLQRPRVAARGDVRLATDGGSGATESRQSASPYPARNTTDEANLAPVSPPYAPGFPPRAITAATSGWPGNRIAATGDGWSGAGVLKLEGPGNRGDLESETNRPDAGDSGADRPAEDRPRSAADALRPLGRQRLDDRSAGDGRAAGSESFRTLEGLSPRPSVDAAPSRRIEASRSAIDPIPLPPAVARPAPDPPRDRSGTAIDLESLRQRVGVRFSNSVRFSLEYELESIGRRGIEAVELWGTVDAGENWKRWGSDPDLTSPFDIEVLEEGIFGFRSVVIGGNGLVSPSPRPGDPPDIAVVVDTTPPKVRLTSVRYGEGDQTGSLVIRYDCGDKYLAARPVTLSFSDRPDGPWTTIAAGLVNDGEYVWPADPELPCQIYLRIDAVDQAENVGTYILDRPVETQGLAPRARIRGFRSVTGRPPSGRGQETTAGQISPPRR